MSDSKTATIKLVNIYPYPTQMSGETFHVEVDGRPFIFEAWATNNSGGLESYDEDGAPVAYGTLPDEVDDEISNAIDTWNSVFYAKWADRIQPVLKQIIQETIDEVGTVTVEYEPFDDEEEN